MVKFPIFIDDSEKFWWNNFAVFHVNRIENHAQEQLRTAPSMFKVKLPRADEKASWGRCGHCPRVHAAQIARLNVVGTAAAVPQLQTPMDGRFYNDQPLQKDIIFISALSAPASCKCTYHRWSGLRQMADAVNRFSWFFIFFMVAVSAKSTICQFWINFGFFWNFHVS